MGFDRSQSGLRRRIYCLMFLYGVVRISLVLNYTTEVRRLPVMGEDVLARTPVSLSKIGAVP